MSNLKKINEAFEEAVQAQVQQRLEMRDGQVIVVRKYPSPQDIAKETFWARHVELQAEVTKQLSQMRAGK